jgi:hypothetical protein
VTISPSESSNLAIGRSGDSGSGYDFDRLADDLAAVLDSLDVNNATLVAHSMGCGEVSRYLTRHGSRRVARIALLAPTAPFPLKTADNPDGIDGAIFAKVHASWMHDFPGSEFKVYEGASHGLFNTHMDRINADLLQFVQG